MYYNVKKRFPRRNGRIWWNEHQSINERSKKNASRYGKSQTELANKEFDASVGGGAVYVKVSGSKELKEIKIQKEAVNPEDVEMLQDLILSCVNEALRKVDSAQAQELGKYNIPGLM